jgi:hypothetical protein
LPLISDVFLRFGSGLVDLRDDDINLRIIEAVSVFGMFDRNVSERYLRCNDDLGLVVKSIPRWKIVEFNVKMINC